MRNPASLILTMGLRVVGNEKHDFCLPSAYRSAVIAEFPAKLSRKPLISMVGAVGFEPTTR
jgi:hypothetical protein